MPHSTISDTDKTVLEYLNLKAGTRKQLEFITRRLKDECEKELGIPDSGPYAKNLLDFVSLSDFRHFLTNPDFSINDLLEKMGVAIPPINSELKKLHTDF